MHKYQPDREIFDSRDLRFKSPYGAVAAGTPVKFTLRPLHADGYTRALLIARLEFWNEHEIEVDLALVQPESAGSTAEEASAQEAVDLSVLLNPSAPKPEPTEDADLRDEFTGVLDTGDYVGLVWYSLILSGPDGRYRHLGTYQLTVYDGSEEVPDWYGQGMCYQIFPDRFCRTCVPDPTGMVGGRTVHESWSDEPVYRPNQYGEIRNRDFFGGNLNGIIQQLDYLKDLGVETIYFNPIFEAAENHRYGTADYSRIDPMLGTNEDFTHLCDEAHARGMKVMLDGVFNHAGFVSRYFNGDGFYPEVGAFQSEDSPYRPWFNFTQWPHKYESWWGIYSLPAVNEHNPEYRDFIFAGEDSVVRRWLRAGADGWRLDVADELPDDFVAGVHAAAREEKPSAVVIGEVWEDGSTKIAYGVRRKHLLGRHCDGLMNYPFRNAAIDFFTGGDAANFVREMETLRENYPPFAFYSAMNSLGTHDTPRILTLLGAEEGDKHQSKDWKASFRMDPDRLHIARERLKAAAVLLFAFPGSPTVYYGDEAGMEGFEDPFNRRTYPWGKEDTNLISWYRALGNLRKTSMALRKGDIQYLEGSGCVLAFTRSYQDETLLCAFNAGDKPARLAIPGTETPEMLIGHANCYKMPRGLNLNLPARTGTIWKMK